MIKLVASFIAVVSGRITYFYLFYLLDILFNSFYRIEIVEYFSIHILASTIPKDYVNKSSLLPDDLYIIGGHPAEPRKCFRTNRFLNLSNLIPIL